MWKLAACAVWCVAIVIESASGFAQAAGNGSSDVALRAAFESADTSGDGRIDEAEFAADTISAFVSVDRNGDERLSADELGDVGVENYKSLDKDGSGNLSIVEVMNGKIAQFEQVDANHDGELTLEEIKAFEQAL